MEVRSLFPKSWPAGPSSAPPTLTACTASHHISHTQSIMNSPPSLASATDFLAFKTYSASWQSDREKGVPQKHSLSPAVGWIVKSWMVPEPSAQADRDDLCCTQMHPAGRNKPRVFLEENTEMWWLCTAPCSSYSSCFSYFFPGKCYPLQQRWFSHWGWCTGV